MHVPGHAKIVIFDKRKNKTTEIQKSRGITESQTERRRMGKAGLHEGTKARKLESTKARRHDCTAARRHDCMTARLHNFMTSRRIGERESLLSTFYFPLSTLSFNLYRESPFIQLTILSLIGLSFGATIPMSLPFSSIMNF
jgi:hypothetical protein